MEMRYLEEFLVLAGSDSYYNAAEKLYISSSSLSKHIKCLEDECGTALFDHTKRTIRLTECGEIFARYAKRIVSLDRECREEISRCLQEKNGSVITVGTIPPQMEYHFAETVDRFESAEGHSVQVEVVESDSLSLLDALAKDRLKFVLVENWDYSFAAGGEYEILPYCRDWRSVLLRSDHPLAGLDEIPLERLKEESFVSLTRGSHAWERLCSACRNAGFEPEISHYVSRDNDQMDMVARGKGIALVLEKPAEYYLNLYPDLRMVRYTPQTPGNIDFVFKKDAPRTEEEERFVRFMTEESAKAFPPEDGAGGPEG